jgi:hypothetical protein
MTHIAPSTKDYQRRQIVARMGRMGEFRIGRKRFILWKYMTFWTGGGPAIAAEFVRRAETDKEGFLRLDELREGELVVAPGFIYRKIAMTGNIMAEHLKKMKTFKPRPMVEYYKDTAAGAVDLGTTDMRTKN